MVHDRGALPCQELQQDDPKSVHVGLLCELARVNSRLGWAVAIRSCGGSGWGSEDREAIVGDPSVAQLVNEDVGGFDVTVYELEGLARAMNECDPASRPCSNLEPGGPVKRSPSNPAVPFTKRTSNKSVYK